MLRNKSITRDFQILSKIEAGIMLRGVEVKSIRDNKVDFSGSYVRIMNDGSVLLLNLYIGPFLKTNKEAYINGLELDRERTLLLHSKEIEKLKQKVNEKGLSLIPSAIYFKGNKIKVEISLCKGLRNYDKKKSIIEKDLKILSEREIRERNR